MNKYVITMGEDIFEMSGRSAQVCFRKIRKQYPRFPKEELLKAART